CFRLAIVGASQAMGLGVETDQTFEALIEARLNKEHSQPRRSYEFLNFSVTGYKPFSELMMLETKAFRFKPNIVIFPGHHGDANRWVNELMQAVHEGIKLPPGYLQEVVQKAQINADTPAPLVRRKLRPYTNDLLRWVFGRVIALCHEHGAEPYYILLPLAP